MLKLALGSEAAIAGAERLLARPLGATRPALTGSTRGNDGPPPPPPFAFGVRPRSAHRRWPRSSPRTASPRRPRGRQGGGRGERAQWSSAVLPRPGTAKRQPRAPGGHREGATPGGAAPQLGVPPRPHLPALRSPPPVSSSQPPGPARHGGRASKVSAWGAGRAAASGQLRPPPLLLPAAGGRGRGWDS